MSDDGELHVVVDGENDDAGDAGSTAREIERLNRQADVDRARTARAKLETARLNREGALRKLDADLLTLDSETSAAEAAYRNAREFGDVDAEVAATKRLSAAESRRSALEMQRGAVERMPITSGDGFEDHLARFTEPTARWMREHRDWVEDPRRNAKLVGAHQFAIADGLTPDTDECFAHVEKTIGLRTGGNGSSNVRSSSSRSSPSVAPVNGSISANSYSGGNNVRGSVSLTKGEVERANDGSICWNVGNTDSRGKIIKHGDPRVGKPIGNVEYARRRLKMEEQGYYSKLS